MWYFGVIWHAFQILNVSVGDLTGLGGCLNTFLVPESMLGCLMAPAWVSGMCLGYLGVGCLVTCVWDTWGYLR